MTTDGEEDYMLTVSEVARMFSVDPKTVNRWARAGKIRHTRTLGGHRRFLLSDVRKAQAKVMGPDKPDI